MRAPGWVSTRRCLQRKARDLSSLPFPSQLSPLYATALKSGLHQHPSAFPHLFSALLHARHSSLSAFRHLHRHSALSAHLSAVPSLLSTAAAHSSGATVAVFHGVSLKLGVLAYTLLANSLISLFSKSASLSHACNLFDEMPLPDLVSRNTLMAAHARAGSMGAALKLFDEMPERDVVSWTTVLAGLAHGGDMAAARAAFEAMPAKDSLSWTVMVSGCAARGMLTEALYLFDEMERSGFEPDDTAVVNILSRCGESGLLLLGESVHNSLEQHGRVPCGTHISNALIEMYSKCGDIARALMVFENTARRNVVSWNVLLLGLASHGYGRRVVLLLSEMERAGFRPDKVTFIAVLNGCAHAGLLYEGLHYLKAMETRYGVRPEIEHYGCILDLLGRRGYLEEAFEMVYRMPFQPNRVVWNTLLRSCRVHNSSRLADLASRHLNRARSSNDGSFLVPEMVQ